MKHSFAMMSLTVLLLSAVGISAHAGTNDSLNELKNRYAVDEFDFNQSLHIVRAGDRTLSLDPVAFDLNVCVNIGGWRGYMGRLIEDAEKIAHTGGTDDSIKNIYQASRALTLAGIDVDAYCRSNMPGYRDPAQLQTAAQNAANLENALSKLVK